MSTDYTTNMQVKYQSNAIRNILELCSQGKPIPVSLCTAYESTKTTLWTYDPMYTASEIADIAKADQCIATLPKQKSSCTI